MKRICILLGIFVALTAGGARSDALVMAPANLAIYNCPDALNQVPQVLVASSNEFALYGRQPGPLRRQGRGLYVVRLSYALSHYWVKVVAGKCHTRFPVTVLAHHERHILAFPGGRISAIGDRHWIAGTLPSGVGSVTLVRADSYRSVGAATIDDGCYYFEFVPKGNYLVRFEVSPGLIVEHPIALTGDDESGREFDLSEGEIRKGLVGN